MARAPARDHAARPQEAQADIDSTLELPMGWGGWGWWVAMAGCACCKEEEDLCAGAVVAAGSTLLAGEEESDFKVWRSRSPPVVL